MCMACEEMQLFYAYLDEIEEQKLRAQPWLCEVTVIPQDGEAGAAQDMPAAASGTTAPKSGFICDDPE